MEEDAVAAWKQYLVGKLKPEDSNSISPATFTEWVSTHKDYSKLYTIATAELQRKPGEEPEGEPAILNEKDTKKKQDIKTLLAAASVLSPTLNQSPEVFYNATLSIFQPYLDGVEKGRGREFGMETFTKLSNYWENHFNEDMRRLNVLPPTITTRVSEFVPENIAFVKRLVCDPH